MKVGQKADLETPKRRGQIFDFYRYSYQFNLTTGSAVKPLSERCENKGPKAVFQEIPSIQIIPRFRSGQRPNSA